MNMCNNFKMSTSTTTTTTKLQQKSNFEFRTSELDCVSSRLADVEIRVESSDQLAFNSSSLFESNNMSRSSTTTHQVFNGEISSSSGNEEHPPPLPVKMRSKKVEHHRSVYDNLDDSNRDSLDTKNSTTSSNSSLTSSLSARTFEHQQNIMKNKYKSCIESSSSFAFDNQSFSEENPPPLPPKQKKHSEYRKQIFLCRPFDSVR